MIKTSHSEIQERITNYNPQGKRRVGMFKVRWTDVVYNDMRKACGDRRGWRRIVEEATGSSANDDDKYKGWIQSSGNTAVT
jgi:hypothetical protein